MSVGPLGVGSEQPLLIWHSDVGGKQRAEQDQLLPSARGETDQSRSSLAWRTINSKLKEFSCDGHGTPAEHQHGNPPPSEHRRQLQGDVAGGGGLQSHSRKGETLR